jgi:hypothetical protein
MFTSGLKYWRGAVYPRMGSQRIIWTGADLGCFRLGGGQRFPASEPVLFVAAFSGNSEGLVPNFEGPGDCRR